MPCESSGSYFRLPYNNSALVLPLRTPFHKFGPRKLLPSEEPILRHVDLEIRIDPELRPQGQ